MDEYYELPTRMQVAEMGVDIGLKCPTNVAEMWARILHRLSLYTSGELTAQLRVGVDSILDNLPYRMPTARINVDVPYQEAYNAGFAGNCTQFSSTLTLHALVSAVEQSIGHDHVDIMPVRWYRRGLRDRCQGIVEGAGYLCDVDEL